MKKILWIALLLVACGGPELNDLHTHLSGYWEIEKVVLPDETERTYSINTTVDYIELQDSVGLRKKVQPQLDGSYKTSNQIEYFKPIYRNDSLILAYHTEFDVWDELVVKVGPEQLVIKNAEGNTYFYKPYEPINLE